MVTPRRGFRAASAVGTSFARLMSTLLNIRCLQGKPFCVMPLQEPGWTSKTSMGSHRGLEMATGVVIELEVYVVEGMLLLKDSTSQVEC